MVQLDFGKGEGAGKTRGLLGYSAFSLSLSLVLSLHQPSSFALLPLSLSFSTEANDLRKISNCICCSGVHILKDM